MTVWGVTSHYPQLIAAWDAAWDKEHSFGVPILADYDREVSKSYVGLYDDPLPAGLRLTSKRSVLGISKDGVVRSMWVSEVPGEGPDDAVVKTAIDAARG